MGDDADVVVWKSARGLRCVMAPYFAHVQLRLLRGIQIVKTEVFQNQAQALVASRRWRRQYSRRLTTGSVSAVSSTGSTGSERQRATKAR
jgi:hypothetical protein